MRPSELGNFRKIATSKVKQTNNYNKKGERYEQYYISKGFARSTRRFITFWNQDWIILQCMMEYLLISKNICWSSMM